MVRRLVAEYSDVTVTLNFEYKISSLHPFILFYPRSLDASLRHSLHSHGQPEKIMPLTTTIASAEATIKKPLESGNGPSFENILVIST